MIDRKGKSVAAGQAHPTESAYIPDARAFSSVQTSSSAVIPARAGCSIMAKINRKMNARITQVKPSATDGRKPLFKIAALITVGSVMQKHRTPR